jgi:protein gp88
VLDDLAQWEVDMLSELAAPKYRGKYLRVHDSGDYFSDDYLSAWLRIARQVSDVTFYSYTKEVSRFRRLVEPDPPPNFLYVFSYGGKEDHLLDPNTDRVADVFPTETAIAEAGWHSNAASDLLAVLGPAPVGMRQNNIPHLKARIGDRTFRQWQADKRTHRRDVSRGSAHPTPTTAEEIP